MNWTCALLLRGIMHAALTFPAAPAEGVIAEVDRLVSEKKYLSALKLLNEQENGDSNPDIALKKAELTLKYFVNSINHKIFSFRDLKENEDILKIRGTTGSSEMVPFDFEGVFASLIKNYPENGRLYLALADYHLDVYEKYRGHFEKSDADVLKSAWSRYSDAIALGSVDSGTYFRAGKTAAYMNDMAGAAKLFELSVQKLATYAPARYNLAYAYLFLGKPAEAVPHAEAAYEMYQETPLKADAATLTGQAYLEWGNTESALNYFLLCDKIAPKQFENMKRLMRLYVKLGREKEAKAVGERIFELDPKNPTTSQVFLENYMGSAFHAELPGIFNGLAAKYAGNPEAAGNALFHLSVYYLQTGKSAMALKTVDEAERNFRKSLKEDHAVFKAIGQIRQTAGKSSDQ